MSAVTEAFAPSVAAEAVLTPELAPVPRKPRKAVTDRALAARAAADMRDAIAEEFVAVSDRLEEAALKTLVADVRAQFPTAAWVMLQESPRTDTMVLINVVDAKRRTLGITAQGTEEAEAIEVLAEQGFELLRDTHEAASDLVAGSPVWGQYASSTMFRSKISSDETTLTGIPCWGISVNAVLNGTALPLDQR